MPYGQVELRATTINSAGPETLSYSHWFKTVRAISVRHDRTHKHSLPLSFTPGCLGEMFESAQAGHRGQRLSPLSKRIAELTEQLDEHERRWWTEPRSVSNAIVMYFPVGKWEYATGQMSPAQYSYLDPIVDFQIFEVDLAHGDNMCLILLPGNHLGKLTIGLALSPASNVYHVYTANEGEEQSYCNMFYDYRKIWYLPGTSPESLHAIRDLCAYSVLPHVL